MVAECKKAETGVGASMALVLLAAFTKSAQLPFHLWLPSAMEAPTPAFTMVAECKKAET
ncbi:MAG TPA: proton-conducting transporter membrane subunit, partial [Trueperaceae bacterium]|nr:proton-conducting transporter membrane subunit [Trueperaceae bacterium]